jgi:dTDP-4-amino-4,6-dideoxygalactose transaminase
VIRPFPEPIYVTRPLLPPLADVTARLEQIWSAQWLTNGGVQHEQLEAALRAHLDVPEFSLFNNGTQALLTAIRALDLSGEVITTPFTFPATPHVLAWTQGVTPVFADIDPVRLTLAPEAVEAAITPRTSAILAVHVYGIPCDVAALQRIADRHRLRVIYDAAHAFGVRVGGVAIGRFGDATMFSFHSTKLFHTAEGGGLAVRDPELRRRVDRLKNFGIVDQEHVELPGLNGKLNELQAALGLEVLAHVPAENERRQHILDRYRQRLGEIPGVRLMPVLPGVEGSHQYCAVRIDESAFGMSRDAVQLELQKYNVFTRKYFYPLCSDYPCYRDLPSANPARLPVAHRAVAEVLCLPLYGALPLEAVDGICEMILSLRVCRA